MPVTVPAEEKIELPSQKQKDAVDTLKSAPSAVGRAIQNFGNAVGAKFGMETGEAQPSRPTSNVVPAPEVQTRVDNVQPMPAQIIGKRDPFRPFTLNVRSPRGNRVNLSPLERYELGQLKLVGVVWNIKEPNAVVEDSGGLGYVVKVGTPIGSNEGKVKAIQPEKIVIEEIEIDVFGAKKKIERSMRLAPEKAE